MKVIKKKMYLIRSLKEDRAGKISMIRQLRKKLKDKII